MSQIQGAVDIVVKAILTTVGDPVATVRKVWLPLILLVLASVLMSIWDLSRLYDSDGGTYFQVVPADEGQQEIEFPARPAVMAFPLISTVFSVFGIIMLAIVWHRSEIIHQASLGGGRTFGVYVLNALPIGVAMGMATVVPSIVLGYLSETATFLSVGVALVFMYRVSPVLPAAAVGAVFTYGQAWRETGPYFFTCLILAVFNIGVSFVFGVVDGALFQPGIPWGVTIVGAALLNVIEVLISVAVITQLYLVVTRAN